MFIIYNFALVIYFVCFLIIFLHIKERFYLFLLALAISVLGVVSSLVFVFVWFQNKFPFVFFEKQTLLFLFSCGAGMSVLGQVLWMCLIFLLYLHVRKIQANRNAEK